MNEKRSRDPFEALTIHLQCTYDAIYECFQATKKWSLNVNLTLCEQLAFRALKPKFQHFVRQSNSSGMSMFESFKLKLREKQGTTPFNGFWSGCERLDGIGGDLSRNHLCWCSPRFSIRIAPIIGILNNFKRSWSLISDQQSWPVTVKSGCNLGWTAENQLQGVKSAPRVDLVLPVLLALEVPIRDSRVIFWSERERWSVS